MSRKLFELLYRVLFLFSVCFPAGTLAFAHPGSQERQKSGWWYPPTLTQKLCDPLSAANFSTNESKRPGLFCSCIASCGIPQLRTEIEDLKSKLVDYDVSGEVSPFLSEKLELYEKKYLDLEIDPASSKGLDVDQRLTRLSQLLRGIEACLQESQNSELRMSSE